jgi:hypothetical protein
MGFSNSGIPDLNRSKHFEFRDPCSGRGRGNYGIAPALVCDSNLPGSPPRRPGRAMTTFNRIFTTERLLQIILILAATVAMKLMA